MFPRLRAALRGAGRASAPLLFILGLMIDIGMAVYAQDAAAPKQTLDHVLGTVTAANSADHTVTVKEDKTGTEYSIQLATTKTLIKVEPGAKDLKNATRITADDLQVGDRVEARGTKPADNPNALVARSVVLMSGRALAETHQAQAAEWQHATNGVVSSIDASGKINITTKTPEGPKPVVLNTAQNTEFTRYSPEHPQTPVVSQLAQLQAGDQVRVIGDKSADGGSIDARKVYSGAFRTISATVVSIGPDGKSATVKDLASKKAVDIALTDDAAVHKLPPDVAAMLARRFNPDARAAGGAAGPRGSGQGAAPGGNVGGATPVGGGSPEAGAGSHAGAGAGGPGGGMRRGNGDMAQMLERTPKISVNDLKAGDALVISGVATGADNSRILANTIIAGVEPILQAAPTRQGGGPNLGGDWGLGEMAPPQQ